MDAGRAFREGGKPEDAAKAYRTVLQKYPKTPSVTEAQVRLAELTDGQDVGQEGPFSGKLCAQRKAGKGLGLEGGAPFL